MSDPSDSSPRRPRKLSVRILGWLAVASMLALALLGPVAGGVGAAANPGAIWTSLSTGAQVNANIYEDKDDVYLNGGPQNCGGGGGLPAGEYYFQVTDPSGSVLLSSDAIKFRQVHVNAAGVISGVSGSGNHKIGTGTCNGAVSVQLAPYANTPNNGNEYSVDLASLEDVQACEGFNADSTTFNFKACVNEKNDNYKVRSAEAVQPTIVTRATGSVVLGAAISDTAVLSNGSSPTGTITFNAYGPNDANCSGTVAFTATKTVSGNGEYTSGNFTPTSAGTYRWIASYSGDVNNLPVAGACNDANEASVVTPPEATVPAPTPTPTGGVEETATPSPGVTPPNTATDISPTGSGSDGWRIPLLGIGLLFGVLLLLTPSRTVRRRR
jgi:hypothetical protein